MPTRGNHSNRRDFLFLSVALGLSGLTSPYALARNMKKLGLDSTNGYKGSLIARVQELLDRLDRGEITAEAFITELGKHYGEMDLLKEFHTWIESPHQPNEMKDIFWKETPHHGHGIALFFVAPRSSHPPHAHHDLMSAQCVLKGKVQLRQYDRVARVDDKHLTLKLTGNSVLTPGGCILMTEQKNNVHWFGAGDEAALILNMNISGTPAKTFDVRGSRNKARYYVDPTSQERKDGFILAPEIDRDQAHERFSRRPPSDFPIT